MSIFANPLRDLEWYQELEKRAAAGKGPLHVTGLSDTAKAHFLTSLCEKERPWKLVVTYDEARARELLDDCRCFTERVWLYPARDLLFFAADIRGFEVSRERISIRRRMAEEPDGVVITTIDGLMDRLEEPDRFRNSVFVIDESDTVDLRRLSERLVALGYERTEEVDGIGQFSVRGGIISVDPGQSEGAMAIGMTHWQTMTSVVLPQAIRNIMPQIGNNYIINVKDTSVMFIIGFADFFSMHKSISGAVYAYFPSATIEMIGYLCMTLAASLILRKIEKRMDGKSDYELVQKDALTATAGTYSYDGSARRNPNREEEELTK